MAEHPEKLQELVAKEEADLHDAERELGRVLPELEALYNKGGERPVAKYFEKDEISQILQDVLDTCEATEEKNCIGFIHRLRFGNICMMVFDI